MKNIKDRYEERYQKAISWMKKEKNFREEEERDDVWFYGKWATYLQGNKYVRVSYRIPTEYNRRTLTTKPFRASFNFKREAL